MLDFPRWKVITILLVCFFGFLGALPNFLDEETRAEMPAFMPTQTLALGLDLQGGVHLLLAADTADVVKTRLKNLLGEVQDIRRDKNNPGNRRLIRSVRPVGDTVVVEARVGNTEETTDETIEKVRKLLFPVTQAVAATTSIAGGVTEIDMEREGRLFTLSLTEQGVLMQKRDAVTRSIEVIRKRVDPAGTREITLQRQGEDRIILQVPGESDPRRLLEIITQAAKLTFHEVMNTLSPEDMARGRVPPGVEIVKMKEGGSIAIRSRVIVSGGDLTNAKAAFDQNGESAVAFTFNARGARRFADYTRKNIGKLFAIRLDDEIISAPRIQTAILGGSGQITGMGGVEESTNLATLLKAGALPVALTVMEQRTVGPDLGADSIEAGKWASMLGFVAVIVFMGISYGRFGLAANTALIVNLILIMAALSFFQATLTLPGIAGIVLTIGMAVDANVLVFERIREEQNAGKAPFAAMDTGYAQAFSTIMDANITTFIAAAVLYMLGTGPVQGFAVTLAIGILTSMFTAVMLTRYILATWLRLSRPAKLPL